MSLASFSVEPTGFYNPQRRNAMLAFLIRRIWLLQYSSALHASQESTHGDLRAERRDGAHFCLRIWYLGRVKQEGVSRENIGGGQLGRDPSAPQVGIGLMERGRARWEQQAGKAGAMATHLRQPITTATSPMPRRGGGGGGRRFLELESIVFAVQHD
ncbi:hypothetical protein KC347_g208 [Hortaea werneckii]|nr:hypothetical protein KC347_g208 [Hortaea werneckii]